MPEVHGTIENWTELNGRIWGNLYGDTKGRFKDGTPITTSVVRERNEDLIFTRNSCYRLGKHA